MSRRDNFRKVLNHQQPDNIIIDLGGCPLSTMMGRSYYSLMKYLGIQEDNNEEILKWGQVHRLNENLLEALDIDTRGVGAVQIPKRSTFQVLSNTEYIDEWGIRRKFTGLYWDITEHPLKDTSVKDLRDFDWPDPYSIDKDALNKEAERAKWMYENTDYIICADLPVYGVFELGCWMCGFEDYLCKMAVDEDFIFELSARILDYQKKVTEIYCSALGPYIHYIASGDDFATQNGLFVSKEMFRKIIKPFFAERIRFTRQFTDGAYLHHSCGSVFPLVDELVDCGVEILNPIQPGAADMEPEGLKKVYGDKIVFHGGFDTQSELPFGTEKSIRGAAKALIETMNQKGGYIFAAAHNIQEDVPPENIVTLFKSAREFGKK